MQRRAITLDPDVYTWKPLRLLSGYRFFLGTTFLATHFSGTAQHLIGSTQPRMFTLVAGFYFLASVLFFLLWYKRRPTFATQVYAQSYIDIASIILLMHASGGIESGLGMLLLVSVASAGVLMPGRLALSFAALATLGLLSQQLYLQLAFGPAATAYPQAGILGATLFAISALSVFFTRKGRESAELAELRGIDLENMAELNEHIIEQMDSGILVVDEKNRLRLANGSARAALDMPIDNKNPPIALVAPRLAYSLQTWKEKPNQAPPSILEPKSNAELRPQFVPLGNQGTLVYLEDHSFINAQLQQLKLASLGRLTASIAHEIRNPLAAISHASQLLTESPSLNGQDKRFTQIIEDNCKRMNTIIEDVLQLSKGGNVKSQLLDLPVEIAAIRKQFMGTEKISDEQLTLTSEEEQTQVFVDPNHLRQILWNLWRNAFLHGRNNETDTVSVKTSIGRLVDTGHIYLDITDDGQGIDPKLVEEIFEPFYTSSHSGTGLGLFLARELCEFNNASLSYQPTDTGTCFRIQFNTK